MAISFVAFVLATFCVAFLWWRTSRKPSAPLTLRLEDDGYAGMVVPYQMSFWVSNRTDRMVLVTPVELQFRSARGWKTYIPADGGSLELKSSTPALIGPHRTDSVSIQRSGFRTNSVWRLKATASMSLNGSDDLLAALRSAVWRAKMRLAGRATTGLNPFAKDIGYSRNIAVWSDEFELR